MRVISFRAAIIGRDAALPVILFQSFNERPTLLESGAFKDHRYNVV